MTIRIIKHEAVPQTGSFEVRYSDGRPSVFFTGRTFRAGALGRQLDSQQALEAAKTFARGERDKIK